MREVKGRWAGAPLSLSALAALAAITTVMVAVVLDESAHAASMHAPVAATATAPAASAAAARSSGSAAAPRAVALIDINSAPSAQLATLPGLGLAEAQRIIAGRPYRTKADLATEKVLPAGAYLAIRHRIVALPVAPGRQSGATPKRGEAP